MNSRILEIAKNIKLQIFISLVVFLFFFRLLVSVDTTSLQIFNDFMVMLTVSSLTVYLIELQSSKKINPLSLVMNIGIINAVIFFLNVFSDDIFSGLFSDIQNETFSPNLIFNFSWFFYILLLTGSIAYMFSALREFYFFKQKKNVNTYFNTMAVFFALAGLTAFLYQSEDLSFITNSFMVISIILAVANSLKIGWIAFLQKKEKLSLLVLSVVILTLVIINLINNSEQSNHFRLINTFSPALNQLFSIIMIYGAVYFTILFFTTLFHIPTAEAFDRKAQEVSSLQYFGKLINEVLDFNELAETVAEIGIKVCNADAAWILLKEGNDEKIIANKNIGYVDADKISKRILQTGESKFGSTFAYSLAKIKDELELSEDYSYSAAAPLKTHNDVIGYIFVVKKNNFIFDEDDIEAINTFSEYASVSIENSRLLEESIEKERLEKELDVAREIQRKILPAKNPDYKNLSISSLFIPAFEVGGDYYDFFEISENKLGFVIADVSGKGISAAFIMAEVKGIFESLSQTIESPKEILIKANTILKRTLDRRNFVSAAYGLIDTEKEVLHISRAGHCPVLLVRENEAVTLRPSGIGLGLNFGKHFENTLEEIQLDLEENDIVVLFTDGITEAKNIDMEDFGEKQFEDILVNNSSLGTDEISNAVIKEVTLFSQNNSQHDDITLIILKWKQKIKTDGDKEWLNSAPQLQTKVK